MQIKARKVEMNVVDEIKLTAEQWDTRSHGKVAWREHMAKILNLRVQKIAPQCDAHAFYHTMVRFATEVGYGEAHVIARITEIVYNVRLEFGAEATS